MKIEVEFYDKEGEDGKAYNLRTVRMEVGESDAALVIPFKLRSMGYTPVKIKRVRQVE